jgi:hypothetical protein
MSDSPPTLPPFERIPDPLEGAAPDLPPLPPLRAFPRSRTRDELRRAVATALVLGTAWLGGQLALMGIRGDLAQLPRGYLLAFGVLPVIAGVLCLLSAVSAGRLGLGARTALLAGLSLFTPLAFVFGAALGPLPYAGAAEGDFRDGVVCFHLVVAWTLVPLVLAGFALRATFVGRAGFRAAALGSGAGLLAAAAITWHCSIPGSLHVGFGHGGAILASVLLGALVLARVTRA